MRPKAVRKIHNPIQTGDRFGKQVVVEEAPARRGRSRWFVRCECGDVRSVADADLKKGNSNACHGCYDRYRPNPDAAQRAAIGARSRTHGLHGTPTYIAWRAMKSRCTRPADVAYADYGGRGITICPEWMNSFEAFVRDVGIKPGRSHSLNRLENDQGYFPGNVAWSTNKEQQRNTRRTVMVDTPDGRMPLAEACERAGIDLEGARKRLVAGLSFPEIVAAAKAGHRVDAIMADTPDGPRPLVEIAKAAVVPYPLFSYRVVRKGWSIERALTTPVMRRGPLPRKRA